tara:strand:+ start:4078 stop:5400 length:1323 start_codon:yes stop_codon:yes gene_type:complete
MSYTSQIQTKILDPQFFNNTQGCEFRLNDLNVTYLTSMYLGNVGAYGTNGDRATLKYSDYGGVKTLVKNITLYNGGDVLAQLNDAGSWVAFKGQNQDNSDLLSKSSKSQGRGALQNINKYEAKFEERIGGLTNPYHDGIGATEGATGTGYFDIRDLLKELKQITSLDTSVFKNLRLVVNWELDPYKISSNIGTLTAMKATRPILVVDCISDPDIRKQLLDNSKAVSYTCIESDRVVIGAVGPTGVDVRSSSVLRGFDNKVVNRMLLVNQPTEASLGVLSMSDNAGTYGTQVLYAGKNNSIAQYNLKVQLAVNGANLFNGEGLVGSASRQAIMTDTWGDVIANYGSNQVGLCDNSTGAIGTVSHGYFHDPARTQFGGDYTGFKVMDRVKYLELSYTRTGVAVTNNLVFNAGASNQAVNVIVYAEVPKMLMIQGGDYRIAYM